MPTATCSGTWSYDGEGGIRPGDGQAPVAEGVVPDPPPARDIPGGSGLLRGLLQGGDVLLGLRPRRPSRRPSVGGPDDQHDDIEGRGQVLPPRQDRPLRRMARSSASSDRGPHSTRPRDLRRDGLVQGRAGQPRRGWFPGGGGRADAGSGRGTPPASQPRRPTDATADGEHRSEPTGDATVRATIQAERAPYGDSPGGRRPSFPTATPVAAYRP